MEPGFLFNRIGIALLLGLLVGFQREHAGRQIAGVRSFALITVLGAVAAALSHELGPWIVAAGFLGVATLAVLRSLARREAAAADTGAATQAAMLLMYAVGAMLILGSAPVAVAIGGGTAVLLQLKPTLHGAVKKLSEADMRAIMQFALVSAVILPVLPDEEYGPYNVLNPRHIWLMVVLIVGISIAGYLTFRFLGDRVGVLLGGILGGVISSTATTVSYARRTANAPGAVAAAVAVVMIATAVSYIRVLVEVSAVAPTFFKHAVGPIAALGVLTAALGLLFWWRKRDGAEGVPEPKNPSELKAALVFAAVYSLVLLLVAAVRDRLGEEALYIVALISGGVDMDAITLSVSRMVADERLDGQTAWRYLLVAASSNMLFKTAFAFAVGARQLGMWMAALFGICTAAAVLMILFWPATLIAGG